MRPVTALADRFNAKRGLPAGGLSLVTALVVALANPALAQEGGVDARETPGTVTEADSAPAVADPTDVAEQAATEPGAAGEASSDGLSVAGNNAILTLNQTELFENSAWGAAAIRKAEAAAADLSAENRSIEAALETEERELTVRRSSMTAADFTALARAFDLRVEEIRQAQDAKSRAINRRLDEDRKAFIDQAVPLLVELLDEYGAVAILSDEALVLARSSADVTPRAIELMDQRMPAPQDGAGTVPAQDTAAPAPDTVPEAPDTAP
ncbi:OmpH family outer membrane protein [Xinfangfangia sp. D13-10-4-6]|uniref:OmpH family outer membrane protein n=1 Tax=Pseudogemmobacter hezensis TaxID=2737662 RepID=UPI001557E6EB|nr:OmpH family outer membrane protein [Pseudogemmobacter hezensis]NPD17543.1 OmpH family outer membrane protein [Pseudogemmobacter hezensis]